MQELSPNNPRKRSHDMLADSSASPSVCAAQSSPSNQLRSSGRRHDRFGFTAADTLRIRRRAMDAALSDFPYCEKLVAHTSCVNALAFSKGEGRYLASGGDDKNVLLWDMHSDADLRQPVARYRGPRSNIFSIAFNASNSHMYSGGNDCMVMRYDLSRLEDPWTRPDIVSPPVDVFLDQAGTVHSVAPHPYNDHTFLSSSEDGKIRFEDCRSMPTKKGMLMNNSSYTDVKWHPTDGNLFITTDLRGRVNLHDARTAFRSAASKRTDCIVTDYLTTVSVRVGSGVDAVMAPEPSTISFNSTGSLFCIEMLRMGPVLYSLADRVPILSLAGETLPDGTPVPEGQRSYFNGCTTKHGSFTGESDGSLYYGAGSDDFRGYAWKIPPLEALLDRREHISASDWTDRTSGHHIAFAESKNGVKHLPMRISTPSYRLEGHRSIVNTVLYHPILPIVATAGIERVVRIFSHFPTYASHKKVHPADTRELPTRRDSNVLLRALLGGISSSNDREEDGDANDDEAVALFDELLHDEQRDAHNANDLLNTGWRFAEMSDDSSPEISSDEEMLES